MGLRTSGNFLGKRLPNLFGPLQALLALLDLINDALPVGELLVPLPEDFVIAPHLLLRFTGFIGRLARDHVDLIPTAPLHGVQERPEVLPSPVWNGRRRETAAAPSRDP